MRNKGKKNKSGSGRRSIPLSSQSSSQCSQSGNEGKQPFRKKKGDNREKSPERSRNVQSPKKRSHGLMAFCKSTVASRNKLVKRSSSACPERLARVRRSSPRRWYRLDGRGRRSHQSQPRGMTPTHDATGTDRNDDSSDNAVLATPLSRRSRSCATPNDRSVDPGSKTDVHALVVIDNGDLEKPGVRSKIHAAGAAGTGKPRSENGRYESPVKDETQPQRFKEGQNVVWSTDGTRRVRENPDAKTMALDGVRFSEETSGRTKVVKEKETSSDFEWKESVRERVEKWNEKNVSGNQTWCKDSIQSCLQQPGCDREQKISPSEAKGYNTSQRVAAWACANQVKQEKNKILAGSCVTPNTVNETKMQEVDVEAEESGRRKKGASEYSTLSIESRGTSTSRPITYSELEEDVNVGDDRRPRGYIEEKRRSQQGLGRQEKCDQSVHRSKSAEPNTSSHNKQKVHCDKPCDNNSRVDLSTPKALKLVCLTKVIDSSNVGGTDSLEKERNTRNNLETGDTNRVNANTNKMARTSYNKKNDERARIPPHPTCEGNSRFYENLDSKSKGHQQDGNVASSQQDRPGQSQVAQQPGKSVLIQRLYDLAEYQAQLSRSMRELSAELDQLSAVHGVPAAMKDGGTRSGPQTGDSCCVQSDACLQAGKDTGDLQGESETVIGEINVKEPAGICKTIAETEKRDTAEIILMSACGGKTRWSNTTHDIISTRCNSNSDNNPASTKPCDAEDPCNVQTQIPDNVVYRIQKDKAFVDLNPLQSFPPCLLKMHETHSISVQTEDAAIGYSHHVHYKVPSSAGVFSTTTINNSSGDGGRRPAVLDAGSRLATLLKEMEAWKRDLQIHNSDNDTVQCLPLSQTTLADSSKTKKTEAWKMHTRVQNKISDKPERLPLKKPKPGDVSKQDDIAKLSTSTQGTKPLLRAPAFQGLNPSPVMSSRVSPSLRGRKRRRLARLDRLNAVREGSEFRSTVSEAGEEGVKDQDFVKTHKDFVTPVAAPVTVGPITEDVDNQKFLYMQYGLLLLTVLVQFSAQVAMTYFQ